MFARGCPDTDTPTRTVEDAIRWSLAPGSSPSDPTDRRTNGLRNMESKEVLANQWVPSSSKFSPQLTAAAIISACGFRVTDANRDPAV
jgi:hypothetical protein